jgi:inhibitor of Bruton tyrosine kinase
MNQPTGTQFHPKPVGVPEAIVRVALGQDHTIAVTTSGLVYTWGFNQYGQLGYTLDPNTNKENVQKVPRRVIGVLKRVAVAGVAASNIHSACFSSDDLYTWGLNRGQLGYPAADNGTTQSVPQKVGSLRGPVEMLSALDHATICLLKNHEVYVYTGGGSFRLEYGAIST